MTRSLGVIINNNVSEYPALHCIYLTNGDPSWDEPIAIQASGDDYYCQFCYDFHYSLCDDRGCNCNCNCNCNYYCWFGYCSYCDSGFGFAYDYYSNGHDCNEFVCLDNP